MQCEEFEDRLNRLLDSRLSPDDDESLAMHARDCEDCAGLFHAQQRLFTGLQMGTVKPSVDLATRVVSQQHSEVSRRRAAWRNAGWAVLLASAASLGGLALMALKTGDHQPNTARKDPGQGAHGSGLAIGGIGTKQANTLAPDKADEKLGEYFVALATQISDSKEFDEMSESLEPSIKPIRSSFELALDALRRTLPRGKESRPTSPDDGASWLPDLPAIS